MGKFRGVVLVLAIAAAVLSCAKDKTLEEYNNEETLNQIAKYQKVAGRYSGLISNDADNRILGGFELVLKARINTDGNSGAGSSSSGPGNNAKAILETELHFQDARFARLSTVKGYYDPASGIYEADFTVPKEDSSDGSNGKSSANASEGKQISLTGHIGDGHITGSLQGVGFGTQAASFDIVQNGRSIGDLATAAKPVPGNSAQGQTTVFQGSFHWNDDIEHQPLQRLQMSVRFPVVTTLDHFVEIFLPDTDKTLEVNIKMSDLLFIGFPRASWDSLSGSLVASVTKAATSPPGTTVTQQLRCVKFHLAETKDSFKCVFWSDRTPDTTLTIDPPKP